MLKKWQLFKLAVPVFFLLLLFTKCTYKKEAIEYPVIVTPTCDTATVRYSVEVKNIIVNNCNICHAAPAGSGAGIVLDNYGSLKAYANTGRLLNVLLQTPGYSAMPKGSGKLSDCNIAVIRTWIRNGTPNN